MKTQIGMVYTGRQRKKKKYIILIVILIASFVFIYPILYAELINDAVRSNDFSRAKFLLSLPGDINYHYLIGDSYGNTPLEVACMNNNYEMMSLLLQNGAQPSYANRLTQPLEFVFDGDVEGLFERTKLLVESGAELSIKKNPDALIIYELMTRPDYLHRPTLETANAEVLKTLKYVVERGASVEPKRAGLRYLKYVVKNENYDVLAYLFDECDMDVNELDVPLSKTPLMIATELGNLKMVNFLLGYGADKSLKDTGGKTAHDYAIENGHPELAEVLKP